MEQREAYQRLIETVCVLRRLATRLSSRAEIVGAVRQVRLHEHTRVTWETWENAGRLAADKENAALFKARCHLQDVHGLMERLFGRILKVMAQICVWSHGWSEFTVVEVQIILETV